MKITHAEAIALNIPFYAEHVTRAMQRASTHDERVWVVRLETDNGLVGWADNHGQPSVDGLVGQNPASLINRDDIGFGPQVACLDLVGPRQRRTRPRATRRQGPRPLPHLLVGYRYAASRLGRRGRRIAKARVHHL